jgi:hypothetical protein
MKSRKKIHRKESYIQGYVDQHTRDESLFWATYDKFSVYAIFTYAASSSPEHQVIYKQTLIHVQEGRSVSCVLFGTELLRILGYYAA